MSKPMDDAQTDAPPKDCPHENFEAQVDVHRVTKGDAGPVTDFVADVTVKCAECGLPFRWRGVQAGFSFDHPTVSVDSRALSAPLEPDHAEAIARLEALRSTAKGARGFTIRRADSPLPKISDA